MHISAQNILCIQDDLSQIRFIDFWQDVCTQASLIQSLDATQYALWENDSYEFLVLFFAALLARKQVLIAPNRVKDLESELAEQDIYFLTRQQVFAQNIPKTFELCQFIPLSIEYSISAVTSLTFIVNPFPS